MSIQNFVQNDTERKEVFDYLKAFTDKYALRQVYKGADTSGLKNVLEILRQAEAEMVAEFVPKKPKKVVNRAL